MIKNRMVSNPFETIENGKFGKFINQSNYVSFDYKISCLDIFGGHFVNLTLFGQKIDSRKVQNGLNQKGAVFEKNVK
jgi:hypothetical protein